MRNFLGGLIIHGWVNFFAAEMSEGNFWKFLEILCNDVDVIVFSPEKKYKQNLSVAKQLIFFVLKFLRTTAHPVGKS